MSRTPDSERPAPPSVSPRLEAAVDFVGGIAGRLARVWRALPGERRLAAAAAIGLFVSLFLPWYQETVIARGVTDLRSLSDSMTGWGAFSFVEAAVLFVAAGVLLLLFVRAEGRAFHVPGGDGTVITVAGAWTCVLILWRMFDQEGTTGHHLYTTTTGIEWGIFVALAIAGLLTYAGTRVRIAHEPEPPLPGERPPRRRRRRSGAPAPRTEDLWVETEGESELEETWLALEQDMPRRAAPPAAVAEPAPPPETAVTEEDTEPAEPRTERAEPRAEPAEPRAATAEPASATTRVTVPLPPASPASPGSAPRRRRPRSLANPSSEDPSRWD